MFVIDGIALFLMKLSINRQQENKKSLKKWIKLCFIIEKLIGLILLFILTLVIIDIVVYNPFVLIGLTLRIFLVSFILTWILKKIPGVKKIL